MADQRKEEVKPKGRNRLTAGDHRCCYLSCGTDCKQNQIFSPSARRITVLRPNGASVAPVGRMPNETSASPIPSVQSRSANRTSFWP
ncbi:hypothetical protein LY78DRAFT_471727 [Colletotrichum sublineola]|nr:hypothetical protein LY78DRAFT_471727 [Colletotrichum sublineola]